MIARIFVWLVHTLAFRWLLGIIAGYVGYLAQAALPDAGWLYRGAVVFVTMIVIGWLLEPLKSAARRSRTSTTARRGSLGPNEGTSE